MMSFLLVLGILSPGAHPRLYHTPQDVARARLNVQRFEWARKCFRTVCETADEWAAKSDDELRALVPPPHSTFAYGFSGCPACGADWSWWGQGQVASLEKPGRVTCPSCKREFPDADHPDTGTGWHNEADGKTYYFVGCYNAFAAQRITLVALPNLTLAYAVTGESKYARAAAVLFDSLAETYPTSIVGSVDYPSKNNYGRLERPQYQVARVLVLLADYLDLLYDSPEFAAPSSKFRGSIRQHVEEAVIRDGGRFCYGEAVKGYMGLTNGQADYVRGALAAGLMLGEQDWIDCAVKGPYSVYSFLDNCLDRDGQYYETSVGYADHALSLYVDFAEMLRNYASAEHPGGIDLYRHPKLQKALFQASIDLDCFGHQPRFGDWAPDVTVATSSSRYAFLPYAHSEMLVARAADEEVRNYWMAARESICDGDVEARRSGRPGHWMTWLLFHAEPLAEKKRPIAFAPNPVLGGKGIGVLRTGSRPDGAAALLRYGPAHNHGHLDDLNLNYYALGRELTYDLGYTLGSAHVQTGWSHVTASHNLVVVNEKSQMRQPGGGGSAHLYLDAAPVRAFEASSEASYSSEKVETYRRTLALVDVPAGSYLVDVFRVVGGSRHDQMWHFAGELAKVEGAAMGDIQTTGSLAGSEFDWGRKVGASGDLIGCADKGPYWVAPPGNGYGFLYDVRRSASLGGECAAVWSVNPKGAETLTLRLLPEPATELITARGPGILPNLPNADYAILRRRGERLRSDFVSVLEASRGASRVRSARRLEPQSDTPGAVGVEVQTEQGTDYILSAMDPVPTEFVTSSGDTIRFAGRFAFIRTAGGKAADAVLAGGTELEFGSTRLSAASGEHTGTLTAVDPERSRITLSEPLPAELAGQFIYLDAPGYSHNSPYRIKEVTGGGRTVVLDGDFILARGHVPANATSTPGVLANEVPLPRATVVSRLQSGYFRGKLISNDRTGETSVVIDVESDQRTVRVRDEKPFAPGDHFTIYDIRPGDRFRVPVVVRRSPGWGASAPSDLSFGLWAKTNHSYLK